VRIMVEPQSVNVLLNTLVTPMSRAGPILVFRMLVDLMRTVQELGRGHFVHAEVAMLEVLIAGVDVGRTLVLTVYAGMGLNAQMLVVDLFVNVDQDIREILIRAAFLENVTKILTVDLSGLVRTISVWTLAPSLVDKELTAPSRIMWQFVDAPEEPLEIPSEAAGGLLEKKFVPHVVPILIVKLDKMTVQFVGVKTPTLEILFRAVDMNVTLMANVVKVRNATDSHIDVNLPVVKVFVVKMPIVRQSTTEHNVPVHLISLETPFLDVTLSALDTPIVLPTKPVSDLGASSLVSNPIQMFVDKELLVNQPIIRLFVVVHGATLVIRL